MTAGRVRIEPFGESLEIRGGESVLAAILRQGRFVRYGCKHGGCGTCRAELVKLILGGQFSSALARLRPGDRLRLRGPLGQFAVRLSHRPMVMVAGGAGMGPIRAMLLELARTGNARQVRFFYGARHERDLLFMDELRALEHGQRWLRVTPALSCPEPGLPWDGEVGLITDVLARAIPDARGVEGYLCGPPGMIDAAIRVLLAGGCKEQHIYFDRFVPSGAMAPRA